jgi:hypothetical protein
MNLPLQAPPVRRGHDRVNHMQAQAINPSVAQSQLSGLCALCAFAPPPYSLICTLLCPGLLGSLGHA